ncbi:Gfo/Idh/MocA family oxidoreductase [Bradyrhizobium sp. B117]|uniref:Gfo/Idh/MocA family protein n=1 Tax=Bradyrhizobium sp. B117 TaxID=3140246 RepID=UPI003183E4B2
MKVGILGSGFGLYGYFPAMLACGSEPIFLPERYRAILLKRDDVGHLVDKVQWCADEETLLDRVDAIIIARRPADQVELVADCCRRGNIRRVLLEKPIAPNPEAADRLVEDLLAAGKKFRIAYAFRYTDWGKQLLRARVKGGLDGAIKLVWHFLAHHRKTRAPTWKRHVSMGGGAMRFFGIHLIALLSELGYTDVLTSQISFEHPDEADRWQATFTGPNLPLFEIDVDANASREGFSVGYSAKAISLSDPFQAEDSAGKFDRRVRGLAELCSDFLQDEPASLSWYRGSLRLWSKAEEVTQRVSGIG